MRGRLSPWVRVRRLEGRGQEADVRRLAEDLGAELGMTAEQVMAEARAFAAEMGERGATTLAEACRVVAADEGLDPADVRAEAEQWLAGLGR